MMTEENARFDASTEKTEKTKPDGGDSHTRVNAESATKSGDFEIKLDNLFLLEPDRTKRSTPFTLPVKLTKHPKIQLTSDDIAMLKTMAEADSNLAKVMEKFGLRVVEIK